MTLHDEIMNIPCEPIEGTESEVLAFKLGHKQALHAAAELADRSEQKLRDEVAALKNDLGLACALLDQATACSGIGPDKALDAHIRVEQFAEELRAKIANNGKENDYGEKCEFSAETIARLQSIVEDAERTAKLMKVVEWLYSGDTGENGFAASVTDVRRTAMIRAHAAFASAEAIREGRTNDQTSPLARAAGLK